MTSMAYLKKLLSVHGCKGFYTTDNKYYELVKETNKHWIFEKKEIEK